MIETSGDLVLDLLCVQQASCLEGGPLLWIWPLYLHVNQKSDDDHDDEFYLSKKIRFDVSCESSAKQRSHMKHQVLFSLKNNEKIFMNVVCCSRDQRFKG